MKTTILTFLATAAIALAGEGHSHEKQAAGPHGGKLLEIQGGHAEFFVTPDRKAEVFLFDDALKPVATGAAELAVTAGTRENPAKLAVEKSSTSFVTAPLPSGSGYWVILQYKPEPSAAAETLRVKYIEGLCDGCKLQEYACTCDHSH